MARTRPGSSATGSVERGHQPPSSSERRDPVGSIRKRGVDGAVAEAAILRRFVVVVMAGPFGGPRSSADREIIAKVRDTVTGEYGTGGAVG